MIGQGCQSGSVVRVVRVFLGPGRSGGQGGSGGPGGPGDPGGQDDRPR